MTKSSLLFGAAAALLLSLHPARATVTETDQSVNLTTTPAGNEAAFDTDIVANSTNLLYGQPVSGAYTAADTTGVDSNPIGADYPGFSLSNIDDGAASSHGDSSHDVCFLNGDLGGNQLAYDPAVTFTLAAPSTVNSIQTIFGWQNFDQSWSDQSYSVYYTTTTDSTFTLAATVNYHPYYNDNDNPGDHDVPVSSEVTLNDLGLTNVTSLEFVFSPSYDSTGGDESGGAIIREVQAFATDVPEPSTWAMLIGGLLAMVGVSLWRRGNGFAR